MVLLSQWPFSWPYHDSPVLSTGPVIPRLAVVVFLFIVSWFCCLPHLLSYYSNPSLTLPVLMSLSLTQLCFKMTLYCSETSPTVSRLALLFLAIRLFFFLTWLSLTQGHCPLHYHKFPQHLANSTVIYNLHTPLMFRILPQIFLTLILLFLFLSLLLYII